MALAADAIKRKSEIVVRYSRRRRALTIYIYYGHKSYFKLVTETNGEGREFMSLFIARSTLDVIYPPLHPTSLLPTGAARKTLLVH